MKYFDTFTGYGGFTLGIQRAYGNIRDNQEEKPRQSRVSDTRNSTKSFSGDGNGGRESPTCIGFSEVNKYAIQVYQKHFPEHKPYGDITKINPAELPDFDLLTGGFPCQAFSIAGKRAGFEDSRGTLFFDIARIAKAKQPMFMLLENVKGLVSHDKGKTLEVILASLQELGYYVNYDIHNAKDYGVPQNRERIFFVCKHIKGLASVGQSEKISTFDAIIQEWLFQLLLNNLKEVKRLQEHNSKDWVVGWLILNEIKRSLDPNDESITAGITPTDGSMFQSPVKEVWQSIDTWLNNHLEGDLNEEKLSTTSTAIKRIIASPTYTYSQMLMGILLATVQLRHSSKPLWNEILSSLILIQEGTNYARVNNKNEKAIITENGVAHLTDDLQDFSKRFIVGHLGGIPERKVFPIGGEGEVCPRRTEEPKAVCQTLKRRYPDDWNGNHIVEGVKIRRLTPKECERLMSIPDGWTAEGTEGKMSDTQRYKLCGNGVVVNVVEAIVRKLYGI